MGSSKKTIELFYDCISPYSFYAFEILQRYSSKWNIDVKYKPVIIGGIMKATNNKPPGMNPTKGAALLKDLERCSRYFNVPVNELNFLEMIEKGSLSTMRFLTSIRLYHPEYLTQASRFFWLKRFKENKDFTTMEAMTEVAIKAGMKQPDVESVIEKLTSQEVKNALKDFTNEAVDKGAFGLPTIVAYINDQPELFFGSDRFPIIAQEIGEKWMGPEPGKL